MIESGKNQIFLKGQFCIFDIFQKEPVYFKQPFSYFSNIHLNSGVM